MLGSIIAWRNYMVRNGGIHITPFYDGSFDIVLWIVISLLTVLGIVSLLITIRSLMMIFEDYISTFKEWRREKSIAKIKKTLVTGRVVSRQRICKGEYSLGIEYKDLFELIDSDIKTLRKYKKNEKILLVLVTNIDKKGRIINQTLELPV